MHNVNRNTRNAVIVIIVVLAFVFLMVRAKLADNILRRLQGPIEGTENVFTVGGRLSAASKNNHIYAWQWEDLSKWPTVAKPNAQKIIPIANDKLIYVPTAGYNGLVLCELKGQKEIAKLDMPDGAECKKIKASSNGQFGAVLTIYKEGMQKNWAKLGVFDAELKSVSFVFQGDTVGEEFQISDFDIANEGELLVGVGQRKGKAWVFTANIEDSDVLWEKTFDEYSQFTLGCFSSDDKTLFIGEKFRHILAVDVVSGRLLKTFSIAEYSTVAHLRPHISCMSVSFDGKVLAANTEPAGKVWLWNTATGDKIGVLPVGGGLVISGVAFSPDSKFLATSCMVSPEIKIWKLPQIADNQK